MKVREKANGVVWDSSQFNIHGMGEIIIQHEEYGADSVYLKNFDIFLNQKQEWKDMAQAFKDKDLIVDNYNTYFLEPPTEDDKRRGFTL